jgi:hypothetical protein
MSEESPRSLSSQILLAFSFEEVTSSTSAIDLDGLYIVGQESIEEESASEEEESIGKENSEDENSSQESRPDMTTPAGKTITINGRKINIAAMPQTVVAAQSTPLYKKEDCLKLTGDKLNNLFDKANKSKTSKFD